MNKKKIYYNSFALTLGVTIAPIATILVTSCGDNKGGNNNTPSEQQKKDATLLKGMISSKTVVATINKESIKLTDFDQNGLIKIGFKYNGNNDQNNAVEINDAIKRSYITFVDYLLPKLNLDSETILTLKINNSEEVKIKASELVQKDGKAITINKLNQQEIKTLIEEKLNKDITFISSSVAYLRDFFEKKYKENSSNFKSWWDVNGVNNSKTEYTNFLFNKYPNYFSKSEYPNLNVDVKGTGQSGVGITEFIDSDGVKKWNIELLIGIYTTNTSIPNSETIDTSYNFLLKFTISTK